MAEGVHEYADIRRNTGPTDTYDMLADEFAQVYGVDPPSYEKRIPPRAQRLSPLSRWLTFLCRLVGQANPPPSPAPPPMRALYADFHQAAYPRTALCLSGGGIRSAAFALGVIQVLARNGLLDKFQYLSTVSGGGYIGSWLSAWLLRSRKYGSDGSEQGGSESVRRSLAGRASPDSEAPPIERLRENSNYLTPKLGLLSGDTWTTIAISARNLVLNWLIVVPFICAAALLPQLLALAVETITQPGDSLWAAVVAVALYVVLLVCINSGRPRWRLVRMRQSVFLGAVMVPALLAALAWTMIVPGGGADYLRLRSASFGPLARLADVTHVPSWIIGAALFSAVIYLLALLITWAISAFLRTPFVFVSDASRRDDDSAVDYTISLSRRPLAESQVDVFTEDRQGVAGQHYGETRRTIKFGTNRTAVFSVPLLGGKIDDQSLAPSDIFVKFKNPIGVRFGRPGGRDRTKEFVAYAAAGAVFGVMAALGQIAYDLTTPLNYDIRRLLLACFGVPWLLLSHGLAQSLFLAFASRRGRSDEEREWLGRAGGWLLIFALGWAAAASAILLLPLLLDLIHSDSWKTAFSAGLAAVGGVSGIVTAVVGGGAKTPPIDGQNAGVRKLALYIAAPLFLVLLAVGLSLAVDFALFGQPLYPELRNLHTLTDFEAALLRLFAVAVGLVFGAALLGRVVNVNRFSLHELYRNRLVRAFLGASNEDTSNRDLFTSFNFTDNVNMCRLWRRRIPTQPPGPFTGDMWRPFHIINIALNVVAGRNLAWQERKAESFTVTPLWCGAANLDAFRRTSEYGGIAQPITLGTAMAISGAAVSPNMGYNSSPLVTFLLTLFNVRLGWWFGNPKKNTFPFEGPRFAVGPLLVELFGLTNDARRYVYLSDGGHFENLGLYEMVRRRCHFIVVSDAGMDRDMAFADLANATRKIAIDLGIRIDFPRLNLLRKRNEERAKPDEGGPCYTIGKILYSEADGNGAKDGTILYLKPGFRGDEAADIVGYAAGSKEFPHEATVDQWFSESQFESYRALGSAIMRRAYAAAWRQATNTASGGMGEKDFVYFKDRSLAAFFDAVAASEG